MAEIIFPFGELVPGAPARVPSISPGQAIGADLAELGGKGLNLVKLAQAAFPVPGGFVVTTAAYRAFVSANALQPAILDLAASAHLDQPASLEAASVQIRALFQSGALPADLASEIAQAYAGLCETPSSNCPVAVRSSATAEDLPGLSFAGQQDTFLNVTGATAVLAAVVECWSSLWTARALGYRARSGIRPEEVSLAVVVQAMVPSETSGVLFTANPLTGRRDEMVIDASFGLGEAIVSGQVEPDHYALRRVGQAWKITEKTLGQKALAIIPVSRGGTEQVASPARAGEQALSDDQILQLAQLAERVKDYFGSPQDLEWAVSRGRLFLLQSRPITSLYPLPGSFQSNGALRLFASFNSIQGVPDPFTPLGLYVLQRFAAGVPRALGLRIDPGSALPAAGDRLWLDITSVAQDPRLRRVLLAILSRGDPTARAILLDLLKEGRIPAKSTLDPSLVFSLLRRGSTLLGTALGILRQPELKSAAALTIASDRLARLRARGAQAKGLRELLDTLETDWLQSLPQIFSNLLPIILLIFASLARLDSWLQEWLGEPQGAALALLRGVPRNVTTEMDLALWQAAQTIRADPTALAVMISEPVESLLQAYRSGRLPPAAQGALNVFLAQYGMRAVAEIDLGRPRWRDDPTPILNTLRAYLSNQDPDLAPDRLFQRGAEGAERQAAEYVARVRRTPSGRLRARLLSGLIRRLRLLGGLREWPKFQLVRLLDVYRTGFLAQGEQLTRAGLLNTPDDLFFLSIESLRRLARGERLDVRDEVAKARAGYDRERARRQLPRLLLSTGETFYQGAGESMVEGEMVGEAVSPGVVEGRARIVLDPHSAALEHGEILVCPATDPGWTPLFLTAAGLVMEIGGLVTHGSVVAREYGIPAVVGIHAATTRIQTGQRLRVDGNRGRVRVLEE